MDNLCDININGIGKLNGGNYKDIGITGLATIFSSIKGENINIEGCCKSNGDISCNNLFTEGTLECKGSIDGADSIYSNGLLDIKGNLQGKEISSSGKTTVNGLMSGDKITLCIMKTNKIKEIGGEEISVRTLNKGIFNNPRLVSDSIEGDRIILENTTCDVVRGDFITIKGGCRIKKVEYTGEIIIDEQSKVLEIIKL